jgi:hypothetical protein
MVSQSANETCQRANSYKTCEVGMCLKYVRTWLGIGSREASAIDAWNAATKKHKGDQHPPRGAPVFWKGGQYGHIALAIDNDNGRSTDTTTSGKVGTENGNWWKNNWGYTYLGWTEDLNGVTIPYLKGGGSSDSPWASGDVYVAKLVHRQQDSDSVRRLCYRFMKMDAMPGSHRPPHLVGNYSDEVLEAARYWQRNIKPDVNGPDDGTSISNPQANTIFGDNYTVHEK